MKLKNLSILAISIIGGFIGSNIVTVANFFPSLLEPTWAETRDNDLVDSRGLFVNLTTDDTWTTNMAINFAHNALVDGHKPVTIFLNVRGVHIADSKTLPLKDGKIDFNVHQSLQEFIKDGGKVIVCPICARQAGLKEENLINGVVMGEKGEVLPLLFSPNTVTISY